MNEVISRWDESVVERELEDYRPVSVLAVLSAAMGLLSASSLWLPSMILVGMIAVILAGIAVAQARTHAMSGTWLAYVGAFLAVMIGTWSLTTRSQYQSYVTRTAEEKAEQWLWLIAAGKVNEAICLRMDYMARPHESQDLDEYFQRTDRPPSASELLPPPAELKEMFLESKTISNLLLSGDKSKITLLPEKTVLDTSEKGKAAAEVFFDVDFFLQDSLGQMRWTSAEVSVTLYRHLTATDVHWQVYRILNHTAPDPVMPRMMTGDQGAPMPLEDDDP